MYCKFCGKEIDNDSTFCKHCGKALVVKQKVVIEFNKPNIDNITSTSKTLLSKCTTLWNKYKIILLAIVCFIIGTIAALTFPFSLFFILEDFFDISRKTEFTLALLCSMLFGAFMTYQVLKDKFK